MPARELTRRRGALTDPSATTQLRWAITVSITRSTRGHRQQPTRADAMNGIGRTL